MGIKDRVKKHKLSFDNENRVPLKNMIMGFAKIGRRKAIWPLLLEKAFAKIYGSYDRLISGLQSEALGSLISSPINR